MKVQVRDEALADMTARRDALSLLDMLPRPDVAAVLFQVQVPGDRAVRLVDGNEIVRRFAAMPIVCDVDNGDGACTGRANVGAHRHAEIVGEFFPAAMTDKAAIALATEVSDASRPGELVGASGG